MISPRTQISLKTIRDLASGTAVWDSAVGGFGARRQEGDAVAYIVVYRNLDGRQRKYTIGRCGGAVDARQRPQ
jgi:hypothetical protein